MAIPFEERIPSTPRAVGMLRRRLAAMAHDCGMDAEAVADVRLAVTEAATNAVIHAYHEADGELMVTAAVEGGELAIVIRDSGPGLVKRPDSPGLGAGLSVIASVVEHMKIVSHSGGTEIHMTFPCPDGD
jgi:serine/threonine-protein kinase RsbW